MTPSIRNYNMDIDRMEEKMDEVHGGKKSSRRREDKNVEQIASPQ